MIITAKTHLTVELVLDHDQTGLQLEMGWDEQLEKFQLAMLGPEANADTRPLNPVERRPGETNQTFFDRACCVAYRHMVNEVTELVLQNSRYDRMQHLFRDIKDKLTHMEGMIDHWDNDNPTEEELGLITEAYTLLRRGDQLLGEVG